jgi:acetyl esterase/lipase
MAKTHWYFLAGMLTILIPLGAVMLVKKFDLLEIRPDEKIVYKTIAGTELALHFFEAKSGRLGALPPAMLLIHGGRWQYGNAKSFYPQCKFFAEQGVSCFVAQYRLGRGGVVDVRGAVEDAVDALAWLRVNAKALHIDASRIAVGGGSSGGQLAAALGVAIAEALGTRSEIPYRRPSALVLYNPMLDLSPGMPDHHLVQKYWQQISPLHHIDSAVPPTLILLGTEDVELPVSSAQQFCSEMESQGGRCELSLYDGQRHGFFQYRENNIEYFDKTNARIMAFLDSVWE